MSQIMFEKFVAAVPGDQNALDIMAGRWWLPAVGEGTPAERLKAFSRSDPRPGQAGEAFGVGGRLDGRSILELGPFEANHTFCLEEMGADVTAIEGNAEAFIKCLIVKEVLNLRARFVLGNFLPMLRDDPTRYDLIFASGVLYHMNDPLLLLRLVADRTERAYFWTHYYDPRFSNRFVPEPVEREGLAVTYYRQSNAGSGDNQRWWGGLFDSACWLERDVILDACRTFGFTDIRVTSEDLGGENGPSFAFTCAR